MKTFGLVFLILGCAAWSVGAGAGPGQFVSVPQQAPARSAADTVGNHSLETDHVAPVGGGTHVRKASDDQQNQRKVSGNKPPASNASQGSANHRAEVPKSRERSASADAKNSDRPGSAKSAGAAQTGLVRNETNKPVVSNRPPGFAKPARPAISNVRHRGANPAIIGGAGNLNSRNTMALDGTHMNRRRAGN